MTQITEGFATNDCMNIPAAQKGRKSVFDQKRRMELMQKIQEFSMPIKEVKQFLAALDSRMDKTALKMLMEMYPKPHEQVLRCALVLY